MPGDPADTVLNSVQIAGIAGGEGCDLRRIDEAGRNVGTAYKLDSRRFIQLIVGGPITKEPDG
ncbi:hypothetical protein D3C73_1507050 [compost metagenome]